jgi:hypothetical protein
MVKKLVLGTMFLVGLSMLALTSCTKDNTPAKPTIEIMEIGSGHSNDGKVAPGGSLHIDAEIEAEGKIAQIEVEIHQETGGTFKITKTYGSDSKYYGLKNADFHEHIDIPANTPVGEYCVDITVIDMEGQSATVDADIEITEEI